MTLKYEGQEIECPNGCKFGWHSDGDFPTCASCGTEMVFA